jgi:Asp-tRNA(Asn)/Glu-tRNA(Gln) amidotransferase A subunit family amidase
MGTQYLRRNFSKAQQKMIEETATQQAKALAERRISARELLSETLNHIRTVNPKVNAIVTLDEAGAIAQADARARRNTLSSGRASHCLQRYGAH